MRKVLKVVEAMGMRGVALEPTEEEMRRAERWYRLGVWLFSRPAR